MTTLSTEVLCLAVMALLIGTPMLIGGLYFYVSPDSLSDLPVLHRWVYYRYFASAKGNDNSPTLSQDQVRRCAFFGVLAGLLPIGLAVLAILMSLAS